MGVGGVEDRKKTVADSAIGRESNEARTHASGAGQDVGKSREPKGMGRELGL